MLEEIEARQHLPKSKNQWFSRKEAQTSAYSSPNQTDSAFSGRPSGITEVRRRHASPRQAAPSVFPSAPEDTHGHQEPEGAAGAGAGGPVALPVPVCLILRGRGNRQPGATALAHPEGASPRRGR